MNYKVNVNKLFNYYDDVAEVDEIEQVCQEHNIDYNTEFGKDWFFNNIYKLPDHLSFEVDLTKEQVEDFKNDIDMFKDFVFDLILDEVETTACYDCECELIDLQTNQKIIDSLEN